MNNSTWQKAKVIFDEVRGLAVDKRAAFLNDKCKDAEELRSEVEKLLASYDSGFLEETAFGAAEILTESELKPGQVIGRYRINELIGSGGMGQVFLADDTELNRPVAFKVLHRDVAEDQERVRRFIQEARAASALNHPNILTIHEIGSFEGCRFIVSEYVEGETLRERMKKGITVAESVDITCQVAAALQAAHSAGIVHRDIKPENVMIRRDALVKVLDFGLAKLTEADDHPIDPNAAIASTVLTNPGLVMGTAAYMSPEQARGKSVDSRTDLWSLGVVFHEMLTGKSPFEGESVTDIITSILRTDTTLPTPDNVPQELQPICRKALTKEKESRYQSAHDLLKDLQGEKKRMEYAIETTPYVSLPGRTDELKTQLIRRRPTLSGEYVISDASKPVWQSRPAQFATLGAIALVVTFAIGLSVYKFNGATPSTTRASSFAPINDETTEKDLDISRLPSSGRIFKVAISPDGKFAAYTTGLSENTASMHLIELSTKQDVEVVPGRTADKRASLDNLSFTPDGSRVLYRYFGWDSEDIFSVAVTGGTSQKVPFAWRAASFSPDGKQIAFHRILNPTGKWVGYDLILADPDGGNERVLLHNLDANEDFFWLGVPQWSNDGKWIACWARAKDRSQSTMYAVNTQDGSRQVFSDQRWSDITGVVWTPDGNMIVAGKESGAQRSAPAQLWLLTKTTAKRITNDPHGYSELSASRDGRVLMTTQTISRNDLWVMTGTDARTARQITHSGEVGGGFASLSDGSVLVVSRINQNMSFWRMNLDGSGRKQLRSDDGTNLDPHATRDGRYILFSSAKTGRQYFVFRINSDGSGLTQLTDKVGRLIDVSADGRWAYYQYVEGKDRFIAKVPVEGGPSVVVAQVDIQGRLYAISQRDGQIAELYLNEEGIPAGLRIYTAQGKELKRFPLATISDNSLIHWTPDGKGVAYMDSHDDHSNVWVIDPNGKRAPRPLTNFTSPRTNAFDFSLDGKKTFVTRPVITNDALLIRSGRE